MSENSGKQGVEMLELHHYLLIFESYPHPAFIVDRQQRLANLNAAALPWAGGGGCPRTGEGPQRGRPPGSLPSWLERPVAEFAAGEEAERQMECRPEGWGGRDPVLVRLIRLRELSGEDIGTLILLEENRSEGMIRACRERQRLQEKIDRMKAREGDLHQHLQPLLHLWELIVKRIEQIDPWWPPLSCMRRHLRELTKTSCTSGERDGRRAWSPREIIELVRLPGPQPGRAVGPATWSRKIS